MSKHSIQEILIKHGDRIMKKMGLPKLYLKVLDKLIACRTAVLGGHAQYCENNHLNGVWYNSCKHRFCPKCRAMPTEEWLINTKEILLDCPHHHIIFTLPHEFNDLWRYNKSLMTGFLFRAAQETLQKFAKDPKYLNATLGILSALHTWGRSLSLHPHLHILVSHGGLNSDGVWVGPKKDSLFPQKPVMMVFRGKFIAKVRKALDNEELELPPNYHISKITHLLNKIGRQDWVVHFCQRYDYAEGVATYLSRYVKSGPLKNNQILSVTDQEVTFEYSSHLTKKIEKLTLSIEDFIRRILEHTPLPGKPTVRYCGLYHSASRKKLNQARIALGQKEVNGRKTLDWQAFLEKKGGLPVCEICGLPLTKRVEIEPARKAA